MRLLPPRTFDGALADAFAEAKAAAEPLFVAAAVYADDRGWSITNQFQGVLEPTGQINYSVMYPFVVKAWHRHTLQADFWMCLSGHVKVGVHCEQRATSWLSVIGEKRPGIMVIPPRLWHGAAAVGGQSAGLLYYVNQRYDPAHPDEDRRAYDSIPDFPWETQHR